MLHLEEIFFRDDSPSKSILVIDNDHLAYLHLNDSVIIKTSNYQFSFGCSVRDGGFVRRIWYPYTSLDEIEATLTEIMDDIEVRRQMSKLLPIAEERWIE